MVQIYVHKVAEEDRYVPEQSPPPPSPYLFIYLFINHSFIYLFTYFPIWTSFKGEIGDKCGSLTPLKIPPVFVKTVTSPPQFHLTCGGREHTGVNRWWDYKKISSLPEYQKESVHKAFFLPRERIQSFVHFHGSVTEEVQITLAVITGFKAVKFKWGQVRISADRGHSCNFSDINLMNGCENMAARIKTFSVSV